jgi:hypothetical protein
MRGARFFIAGICTVGLSSFSFVNTPAVARAQAPTQGPDPTYSSPNAGSVSRESMSGGAGRTHPVEAARRQHAQKIEVRQSIAADSTLLVQLAQELSDQISQEHPDTLTQVELKKYTEIGKLAHKLKLEMKSYGTAGTQIEPLPGLVPAPDPSGKHQR